MSNTNSLSYANSKHCNVQTSLQFATHITFRFLHTQSFLQSLHPVDIIKINQKLKFERIFEWHCLSL